MVATDRDLQLWIGEVKFYNNITRAIRDVVAELEAHMKRDYLRAEFAAITNKIEPTWPHADRLKSLLHRNRPLQTIFDAVCIPVLLTYDSPTIAAHTNVTETFRSAFEEEMLRHHASFAAKPLPPNVRIHLFLFPLKSKAELMRQFDSRLKALQGLVP